ncbi:transglycosylase domain-containing protein [Microbacterium sp.]|uniref:transglycosylase domain-containing protein n=1 Tax=Microbacterium sp. TaxID=51671 RepID=UPI003A91A6CF
MPHSKRTAAGVAGGLLGLIGLSTVAGVLITATVTPAVAVTSAAATSAIDMFNNLPSVLNIGKQILPSTIYYTDDKGKNVKMATYYDQNRSPVTFKQIAPVMYDALLSSEDPRFYEHGGIDIMGTTRAILSNVKGGAQTQGGSSISQQYVKNVLVQQCEWDATPNDDKALADCWLKATDSSGTDGYQRKLQEMRYAIALEQKYSKNDILLGYMNIANFGGTTYGIDAAAMHYFGVHASKLNLAQAATLAGMVQNPNTYRIDLGDNGTTTDSAGKPVNTTKDGFTLTKARQEYVLGRMLQDGKITQKQHDEAVKAPITPKITTPTSGCGKSSAPFFCEYVTDVMRNDPAFGKTAEDRRQLLYKGGLKIYTTLDPRIQAAAQKAQNTYVPKDLPGASTTNKNKTFGSTSVSVEASTGRVLAIAQNTDYTASQAEKGKTSLVYAGSKQFGDSTGFNAGSTFKLFTLVDWLNKGHSLNQVLDGRKHTRGPWTDRCVSGGTWNVQADLHNYQQRGGYFGTPMRFTKESLNTGFLEMARQLDLCDIGNVAQSLGVTRGDGTPLPLTTDGSSKISANNPAPYEVIGSDNVSPMAMAGAYATIANKGVFCQPRVIDKITDSDGNDVTLPNRTCKQVLDPKVAATTAYALKGPLERGGSGDVGNPNDGTPLIGKTGTHEDYQTWLMTSSTKVTTANWVGSANGQVDLYHNWYAGQTLNNARFSLGRSIQAAVDKYYKGGAFPEPDKNLLRTVKVNLPSVIGMSQDDAENTLKKAGFQVTIGKPVDSDQPKGLIATQSPGPGRVAAGTNVTISPSTGQGKAVPDVTGRLPAEAVAILGASGFTKTSLTCQDNPGGDGRVTSTDPSAGTVAGPSTKITVTYQAPDCKGGGGGGGGIVPPGKGRGGSGGN